MAQYMKKENKYFILMLIIAAALLVGIVAENIVSVILPKTVRLNIDVEKVKQKLSQAGIVTREAKHWKKVR